jgi:ATP-dependent Lhr-like helicase
LLRPELGQLASDAAAIARGQKSLFFCQSRKASEQVAAAMRRCGTSVYVHHSAVSKEERALAEQNFHAGGDACIVCTSTLELGIDIGDLDAVLQSNATDTVSSFMQRMGRTGRRAGRHANTTFFCEETDSVVQALAIISLAKQGFVESIKINHRSWPVLIHQLLAMALSAPVTPDAVWQHVSPLSDFRDITRAEFDALVAHLIGANAIFLLNGAIALGPAAERAFGRRNFMELFAVFSTPQSYSVVTTDQRAIGTLSQEFVDSLSDGVSSFILSGRGWSVQRINHTDRTIIVTPSSFGTRPTWGGTTPQFLSFALCQEMLALLTADSPQPLCDPVAAEHLALRRAEMQELVAPLTGGFELLDNGSIRWWTFVGGRINNTLKQALLAIGGDWKIATNNLAITISGSEQQDLFAVIDRLKDGAIWQDTALWCEVAGTLPSYRLSKFQRFMPDWVEREVLVDFLLDVDGGSKWMKCE